MHRNILAAAMAALIATTAMAYPSPSILTRYPDDYVVTVYANGLPDELKPSNETASTGLVQRGNAGVYLCTDRNFSGYCVHIVAPEHTCGMALPFQSIVGSQNFRSFTY